MHSASFFHIGNPETPSCHRPGTEPQAACDKWAALFIRDSVFVGCDMHFIQAVL